ncbi:peptidoglycan-binding protein [Streptomyces sp. NPDC057682]|uniref:peptidoglycan-binding domain-containing protein n=1 Tax=Streptomyces sp. NPDC057682 TaxID=3346210 RepID=UPI0036A1C836
MSINKRLYAALTAGALTAGLLGVAGAAAPSAAAASTFRPCDASWGYETKPYYHPRPYHFNNGVNSGWECYMSRGNTGPGVKTLQRAMNRCYGKSLTLDGIFGAATETALKSVQGKHGLTKDGKYGPKTRNAMNWPHYVESTGAFHHCGRV